MMGASADADRAGGPSDSSPSSGSQPEAIIPCAEHYAFAPMVPTCFQLMGDGRVLLRINSDGTVEGEIEDAGEAAKVFVESLRHQLEPMIRQASAMKARK